RPPPPCRERVASTGPKPLDPDRTAGNCDPTSALRVACRPAAHAPRSAAPLHNQRCVAVTKINELGTLRMQASGNVGCWYTARVWDHYRESLTPDHRFLASPPVHGWVRLLKGRYREHSSLAWRRATEVGTPGSPRCEPVRSPAA